MIIIELSGRRLMTLVTLPMARSRQSNDAIAISRVTPVDEDDAFYISGERCFRKGPGCSSFDFDFESFSSEIFNRAIFFFFNCDDYLNKMKRDL